MKKRVITVFFVLAVCLFTYTAFCMTASAESPTLGATTTRLGGANRYDTAALIADEGWEQAENIIIVNADNYADALVAVPLAYALDAPILPVSGSSFFYSVYAQIESLGATNAYLIGGTSAVSSAIEDSIAARCTVTRICGSTRFETSVKIAEKLAEIKGSPSSVFVASSSNYPDALSASPVAALTGCPILYVAPDGALSDSVALHIASCGASGATVLGGTGSVSAAVEPALKNCGLLSVNRVSGSDRYATALSICAEYSQIFASDGVVLATGESFPDALAGGVMAAKKGIPMLLISNSRTVSGLYDRIYNRGTSRMYVLGGTGSVSDYALSCLRTNTTMVTAIPTDTSDSATTVKTVTIISAKANVRANAGSSFDLLGTVYKGKTYTYYSEKAASNGVLWYEIEYNGRHGFICASYAQLNGTGTNNQYVLSPNYKSKYYIVVYTGSQSVVVYGKDSNGKYNQVIKSLTCSTGKDETPTIKGVFALDIKYRWRLMMGDVYCQYATRFASNYLFHSCIYSEPNASTLSANSYRNLGKKASHGCVRLCTRDAKWIYDNCPLGTQVRVVNASGPAGSSIPALKSGSQYYGWDPSDPSPNSPYNR